VLEIAAVLRLPVTDAVCVMAMGEEIDIVAAEFAAIVSTFSVLMEPRPPRPPS
jgi:hypothetical protein